MAELHYFALSERWVSAANNDAYFAGQLGKEWVFGVAEGTADAAGGGTAAAAAIAALTDAARDRKGSPAAALAQAVHETEYRLSTGAQPGISRDSTHISACFLDDTMNCTILDTGEGDALVIGPGLVTVPSEYPVALPPQDPDFLGSVPAEGKDRKGMIARTLGSPRILKRQDFSRLNIKGLFLLLSSGGLHDYVSRETIAEIVRRNHENVETSCEQLQQEARNNGSERTITIVLVHGHLH